MQRAVVAAYLACALIWGTTWYAIRVSIAAYPTLAAVALRFAIAAAIFLAVTAVVLGAVALAGGAQGPWPPPLQPTLALLYLAVVGSVTVFLLYFWLLDRTSLQVTSTLVFTYPLVAIATDALFERELPLTARAYLGAAITLSGLGVSLRRR